MPSVRESILANVATALGNISIANGYTNNITGGIQRFMQTGLTVATVPTIVVQFDNEDKSLGPSNQYTCSLLVGIDVWAVHDTDSVTGYTWTLIDSLVTDIEKALNADLSRDGNAKDSEIRSIEPFRMSEGMPFVGASIQYQVTYAHDAFNPETVR